MTTFLGDLTLVQIVEEMAQVASCSNDLIPDEHVMINMGELSHKDRWPFGQSIKSLRKVLPTICHTLLNQTPSAQPDAMRHAFTKLLERHDGLRTVFP